MYQQEPEPFERNEALQFWGQKLNKKTSVDLYDEDCTEMPAWMEVDKQEFNFEQIKVMNRGKEKPEEVKVIEEEKSSVTDYLKTVLNISKEDEVQNVVGQQISVEQLFKASSKDSEILEDIDSKLE